MAEPLIRSTRHRLSILDAAGKLITLGLNRGTSGNISLRWDDGFLITPSGLSVHKTHPEDIVYVALDGTATGRYAPSSEWRMHRDIYVGRPDAHAIVHTHAPFCTALAALHRDIPPYHYMIAKAGGRDIRCAPYATFGTQALSDAALTALEDRRACLLANHGMIVLGKSIDAAMALAVEVEELAEGYWRCLQINEPIHLSDEEIGVVLEKFKSYGDPALRGD